MLAAQQGQLRIVELLLDRDARIGTTMSDGRSMIFFAAGQGHSEVVRLLLDRGAEANVCDDEGQQTSRALYSPPRFQPDIGFTSSERRGTVRCRSSFARKPQPLFRADRFQSWGESQLARRNAACPRNRPVFPWTSLEWFDFH